MSLIKRQILFPDFWNVLWPIEHGRSDSRPVLRLYFKKEQAWSSLLDDKNPWLNHFFVSLTNTQPNTTYVRKPNLHQQPSANSLAEHRWICPAKVSWSWPRSANFQLIHKLMKSNKYLVWSHSVLMWFVIEQLLTDTVTFFFFSSIFFPFYPNNKNKGCVCSYLESLAFCLGRNSQFFSFLNLVIANLALVTSSLNVRTRNWPSDHLYSPTHLPTPTPTPHNSRQETEPRDVL